MAQLSSGAFYPYNGSLVNLLNLSVLPDVGEPVDGVISDDDGVLGGSGTPSTITIDGVTSEIDYIGAGTVSLSLGTIPLDSREIAAFSVGDQIYLYAPDGFSLAAGVVATFDIRENEPFELFDGAVDGSDAGELMTLGYTDDDGDQITTGNDTIFGNGGNDIIDGAAGSDTIDGGAENDTIFGNDGDDTIYGGAGNDLLFGDDGVDSIVGGAGNDTMDGGAGNDTLTGGAGDDVFIWRQAGNDVITDFGADSGGEGDNDTSNNDFVDLSDIFNSTTLDAYNTANGTNFTYAIHAMNHDLADGVVNFNGTDMSGPTLTMTGVNGGLTVDQTNVICFASGTKIKTRNGELNIDDLKVGDEVLTLDCGYKPIRWIGSSPISSQDLALSPQLRPIRISAGSLGVGLPESDLLVSPQHRILMRSKIALRMFGEYEVLMAAKHLTNIEGIKIAEDQDQVTYWHFLFQEHQIVFSNGAPTESLFTGPEALKSVSPEARDEIFKIFPELNTKEKRETVSARMLISGRRARKFAERSAENKKLLVAYT